MYLKSPAGKSRKKNLEQFEGGIIAPFNRINLTYKFIGVPIFVEHWRGDNLQFYPNFALF